MYDLETLQRENALAVQSAHRMVHGRNKAPDEETIDQPVFPLAILASVLTVGPPSLARLADAILNSDAIHDFLMLVREYLPQYEAEIMAGGGDFDRIKRFKRYFEPLYFEMSALAEAYDEFTLEDFCMQIPVELYGFAGDDLEYFADFRDGYTLLLALFENPCLEDERVPILEHAKDLVGAELLKLIPKDGFSLDDIHEKLDGTEHEGCIAFADWMWQNTGCLQLDANYHEYGAEEWSRQVVDMLTEERWRVDDLQGKMLQAYQWLEANPPHNFKILLDLMNGTEPEKIAKEQIPLPLDKEGQVITKEV
ncbi:hypothetical protein LCGC14_0262590 [marine sediment metagenome]|uniref:Uncharacterized protein n=1 Tax=marine sediment metagenome TaxID=412755 RepID=A0A0F9U174_9ZZZZ